MSLNFRGAWSASATYQVNDVVLYLTSSYIALSINTNVAPTTGNIGIYWEIVEATPTGPERPPFNPNAGSAPHIPTSGSGPATPGVTVVVGPQGPIGMTGPQGQSYTWRNAYATGVIYNAYDCVSYSNTSYVCIADNVYDVTPGSDASKWNIMTSGGGSIASVFGRTGTIVALVGDYSDFYATLSSLSAYAPLDNPTFSGTVLASTVSVASILNVEGILNDSTNAAGTSGQVLSSTGTGTQWIDNSGGGGGGGSVLLSPTGSQTIQQPTNTGIGIFGQGDPAHYGSFTCYLPSTFGNGVTINFPGLSNIPGLTNYGTSQLSGTTQITGFTSHFNANYDTGDSYRVANAGFTGLVGSDSSVSTMANLNAALTLGVGYVTYTADATLLTGVGFEYSSTLSGYATFTSYADATTGAVTLTLPDAAPSLTTDIHTTGWSSYPTPNSPNASLTQNARVSTPIGTLLFFKKVDSTGNTVTVSGFSGQLIDGNATVVLSTQNAYVLLQSTATGWTVLIDGRSSGGGFAPADYNVTTPSTFTFPAAFTVQTMGDVNLTSDNCNISTNTAINLSSTGATNIDASSTLDLQSTGAMLIQSNADISITGNANDVGAIAITAPAGNACISMSAGLNLSIDCGGTLEMSGTEIDIFSPTVIKAGASSICVTLKASTSQSADVMTNVDHSNVVLSGINNVGQFWMCHTSGAPVNTPTNTGAVAFDPATNTLYIYGGAGWKSTVLS